MARCWTCGTEWEQTAGDLYICESCEDISNRVRSLHGDVRYASDRVSGKFDELIYEQRQGFNTLSSGIQDMAEGMHEIASGIQDIAGGMYEIASAIEWGFGELSWQTQQQTSVLQEITSVLQEIKDNQKKKEEIKADEWRLMAEEHRRRGDYDQALKFFLRSLDANALDYRTYIGLAELYLQIGKFAHAKTYFEKSLPHAPFKGNFTYKSYSLRFIGHIFYCWEDYDKAIDSLKRAVELSPNYTKAYYDLAQYYAVEGDTKNAIPALRKVVETDIFFLHLAERERNFNPIKNAVLQLRDNLREETYRYAEDIIPKVKDILIEVEKLYDPHLDVIEKLPAEYKNTLAYDRLQVFQSAVARNYENANSKIKIVSTKLNSGFEYNEFKEVKTMATDAHESASRAKNIALQIQKEIEIAKAKFNSSVSQDSSKSEKMKEKTIEINQNRNYDQETIKQKLKKRWPF